MLEGSLGEGGERDEDVPGFLGRVFRRLHEVRGSVEGGFGSRALLDAV